MGLIAIMGDGRFVSCQEDPYDDSKLIPAKLHRGRSKNDNKANNTNSNNDKANANNTGGGSGGAGEGDQQRDTQEYGGYDPCDSSDAANSAVMMSWHDLDNIDEDQIKADERKINAGGPATAKEIGHAAAVAAIKTSVDPDAPRVAADARAMRNAAALFDQKEAKGEITGGGDRQAAINTAVTIITGLLLKYEEADDDVAKIAYKFM